MQVVTHHLPTSKTCLNAYRQGQADDATVSSGVARLSVTVRHLRIYSADTNCRLAHDMSPSHSGLFIHLYVKLVKVHGCA